MSSCFFLDILNLTLCLFSDQCYNKADGETLLMVSQVPLAMTLALDVRFLVFIQTMRRFLREACFDLFLAEVQAWI